MELSSKNVAAYDYYLMARAPLGDRLAADRITLRNHAIIDQSVRHAEAVDRLRATYHGLGNAFVGLFGGRK